MLEELDFALQIDSLPFGTLVEFDRSHAEELLKLLLPEMPLQHDNLLFCILLVNIHFTHLQVAPVHVFGHLLVGGYQFNIRINLVNK